MAIEWFSILSPWVGLLLAGSILVLLLSFGILILNEGGISLSLRCKAAYILPAALFAGVALFFIRDFMIELPLRHAETLLSIPETVVYVNGKEKGIIKKDLLNGFQERSYTKKRGSQPTGYVDVIIETKNESLNFRFGQDSLNKDLFWIYLPKYEKHPSLCFLKIDPLLLN